MNAFVPGAVDLDVDGPIATITLNRPQKLNALTLEMLSELSGHLSALDDDESVRAVVLAGAGERAFSAGADIHQFRRLSATRMWSQWIRKGHAVFDQLANLRQPTVAAVAGNAYGGGLEIAVACDIRVMADDATVGLTELGIGTLPGWGGATRLPTVIGHARARRMIFTSQAVDAQTAERWGLVTDVAPRAEVLAEARAIAATMASRAPIALQMTKQLLSGPVGATVEGLASAASGATADFDEGVGAFKERRAPEFPGSFDTPGERTAHLD